MKSVITLQNGKKLNETQFLRYFEKKVLYTIRKYDLLKSLKEKNKAFLLPKVENLLTIKKIKNVLTSRDSVDDIANDFLLLFMKKNSEKKLKEEMKKLLPKYKKEKKEIIRPFYLMKKEEILIYAKIKRVKMKNEKKKNVLSKKVDLWISDLEKKHLEIKNAIVNSLLKIER